MLRSTTLVGRGIHPDASSPCHQSAAFAVSRPAPDGTRAMWTSWGKATARRWSGTVSAHLQQQELDMRPEPRHSSRTLQYCRLNQAQHSGKLTPGVELRRHRRSWRVHRAVAVITPTPGDRRRSRRLAPLVRCQAFSCGRQDTRICVWAILSCSTSSPSGPHDPSAVASAGSARRRGLQDHLDEDRDLRAPCVENDRTHRQCPLSALISMVLWRTSRSRARCSIRTDCCSADFTATNRMVGRVLSRY